MIQLTDSQGRQGGRFPFWECTRSYEVTRGRSESRPVVRARYVREMLIVQVCGSW
jgi:hypothetical protein